nr:MAG TPA: hypothetical protein [Caudoviricetes sp.]
MKISFLHGVSHKISFLHFARTKNRVGARSRSLGAQGLTRPYLSK